jgi:indolepyruvate ferredoxin oxidoreductase beta subunit
MGIPGTDKLRDGIRNVFARKGEAVVEANIAAFDAGLEESKKTTE